MSVDISRRAFLSLNGGIATGIFSGCVTFRTRESAHEEPRSQWPHLGSYKNAEKKEEFNLSPPGIGDTSTPNIEIFHDLASGASGSFFDSIYPELSHRAKDGEFHIKYRDYTFPRDDWSYPMALAARSVQYHAGETGFWVFVEQLLEDYRPQPYHHMSKEKILSTAESVGVSADKVEDDVESWRFYPIIERDTQRGDEFGIDGIPTAVVDPGGEQIVMGAGMGNIEYALEQVEKSN